MTSVSYTHLVSIARALAGRPAVILADEPTGALDAHTSREVLGMLQDLHQQGNTVVLITHDNSIAVQAPVSYTHLDVYKRQENTNAKSTRSLPQVRT